MTCAGQRAKKQVGVTLLRWRVLSVAHDVCRAVGKEADGGYVAAMECYFSVKHSALDFVTGHLWAQTEHTWAAYVVKHILRVCGCGTEYHQVTCFVQPQNVLACCRCHIHLTNPFWGHPHFGRVIWATFV